MTDLTPAMCSSTNKTRDTKEDRHMVARNGAIIWTETEQADMSRDKRMGAADFMLAADNLANILAGNLASHFTALKERPEFAKPELFPCITAYNTEVLGTFVSAAPLDQFDVSDWQLEVWLYVGESARDDLARSSFRAGGPATQNQQPQQRMQLQPLQQQQQQFQRGYTGGGGGGGPGAGAPRMRLRCYACGSHAHVFKDCDGTPTWLTRTRADQRFFEAPNSICPCWNSNSGVFSRKTWGPAHGRFAKFLGKPETVFWAFYLSGKPIPGIAAPQLPSPTPGHHFREFWGAPQRARAPFRLSLRPTHASIQPVPYPSLLTGRKYTHAPQGRPGGPLGFVLPPAAAPAPAPPARPIQPPEQGSGCLSLEACRTAVARRAVGGGRRGGWRHQFQGARLAGRRRDPADTGVLGLSLRVSPLPGAAPAHPGMAGWGRRRAARPNLMRPSCRAAAGRPDACHERGGRRWHSGAGYFDVPVPASPPGGTVAGPLVAGDKADGVGAGGLVIMTSLAGRWEFCAATATMLVGAGDMRPTRLAGCGPRSGSSGPMVAVAVEREGEGEYSDAPPHFTAVTVC
ncbi:hypothetical protein B0H14DRAFT_3512243 [Mycena olivaceomarginata]|nr:hypothetical protein B0H14DRAFT_3512243 [Mycena olivaceomarginata]